MFGKTTTLPDETNALPGRETRPFSVGAEPLEQGNPVETEVPEGLDSQKIVDTAFAK